MIKPGTVWQDRKDIVPILFIIGVVLFGFYKIFLGADFFVHRDPYIVSNFSFGNSIGNGWRPDKGFGISFFYGDSQAHAWTIFSFWDKIAPSQEFAYVSSVVFLDILAGVAMYFFLKLVAPGLGRNVWILCPLIIFTSHQGGIHYLRFSSVFVGAPLLLIVLYKYYNHPRYQHFFYFSLILWFVFAFGSMLSLASVISMGFFFSVTYYLYFGEPLKRMVVRFLLLFSLGLLMVILLSSWMFYSNFVEMVLVGHVREKMVTFPHEFNLVPDVKGIINYFSSILLCEWRDRNVLEACGLPYIADRYNVVAVFPLLLIFFLFRRANSFWEFSMKGLIVIFLIHNAFMILPIYNESFSFMNHASKTLFKVYDMTVLFVVQIALVAVFISGIKDKDLKINSSWGWLLGKGVALLLFTFYVSLTLFCVFSLFMPDILPTVLKSTIDIFSPDKMQYIRSRPKDLLAYVAFYSLYSLQSSMHWYSLAYFSITAVFMLLFLRLKWLYTIVKMPKLFAGLLLICAITMSWTAFPLNRKELAWEEVASSLPVFKPTDRLYFVRDDIGPATDIASYKQKREIIEEGPLKRINFRYGYVESPGLELHGHKSFTQKDVGAFLYHIFNGDGVNRIKSLRNLTKGPLISSELLDMGAVSYYYSNAELQDVPEYLSLYFKSKWLYVYENLNAWPYYYLAEKLGIKKEGKHLENVRRGTAYLAKDDYFPLPENTDNSSIELKEFSYGKMVFDFSGKNEEFLVVADAWHPFWKAYIGEKNLPIVKANEIFKGVRLPKGDHTLTMEFDTSPYLTGVYITIISWILFLSGWFWVYFSSRHKSLVNVKTH